MSVAFDVVKDENGAVALRQVADSTDQSDAIHRSPQTTVILAEVKLFFWCILAGTLVERNLPQSFLPEVHECGFDRHPVNPGGEGRVATKRAQFAENLNECILRQVLVLCNIPRHAQTQR